MSWGGLCVLYAISQKKKHFKKKPKGEKPLLTENCHNEPNNATLDWCPFNFFRTSSDIDGYFPRAMGINLQSVIPFQAYPTDFISRQGLLFAVFFCVFICIFILHPFIRIINIKMRQK